jgi:pimeloyl-ACP methyl ester carboxylesterase
MEPRTKTPLRPARIVAFALVALAALGLVFVHFASHHDRVSVPAGAHAGQLTLKPCHYTTERGSYGADCGTLVVPENRHEPGTRLIALPVTRIRARTERAGTPIFRLEGGPGLTNMEFPNASRFADRHDVVLVGYRGVDGSSKLDCPEVSSALKRSADFLGQRSFVAYANAFKDCASRLRGDGVDLAGYSLPQRVDDLEAARRALGYGRVDLLSESAGTRTAMIYSWRYPRSVHRSVMIGVNPPGHFLWDSRTIDGQIRQYAALCAKDDACRARTGDLAARVKATAADIPHRWGPLSIKPGNVRVASFFGLMSATSHGAPLSGPLTLDSWLSAAKGDPSGLWLQSLLAQLAFPEEQVFGDVAAVGRVDVGDADRTFAPAANRGSIIGNPGTDFLWGGGRLSDAWPAEPDENEYDRVPTSGTETLLINGSLDFATPAQNAIKELLPHLSHGHEVVLPGFGHTDDFWNEQSAAGSHLVNGFLDSGKVDDSLYTHADVDFTPANTQAAIAKILLGVMVGFAALAVCSLLWLARRVHMRGGVGRRAGALLRSLYAVVLGLGGWFLAALIVLTIAPTVPLDNELLAVLSIGTPIGLGIYWAWVSRALAPKARTAGFVAAVGGAFVGAWLGFHVTGGLIAVLTTIVGSAVGANLILLVLDTARDRTAREAATATPRPAVTGAEA